MSNKELENLLNWNRVKTTDKRSCNACGKKFSKDSLYEWHMQELAPQCKYL